MLQLRDGSSLPSERGSSALVAIAFRALNAAWRSIGPPWLMLTIAPIGIAESVSYRVVLPLRILVAGFPLSLVDVSASLLAALGLLVAPAAARRQITPLFCAAAALAAIGIVVGLVHRNDLYYFVRDLRSGIYLLAGIYLAGLARYAPDRRSPFRWLVLFTLVASVQQWLRFLGGMAYGREAMAAGAGLLRDATIYQYAYGLAFGALAATFATKRRLFDDRFAFVVLCILAATVAISLTRAAWLSFAMTAGLALFLPTERLWSAKPAIVASLSCAILPWIALALVGSPLAALPASRLSASAEGAGVLQQIESPTPGLSPGATPNYSPGAPSEANPTPAPTLSFRLSMAAAALAEMQQGAAEHGALVWIFGFGYGHNLASYTFATGDVAVGVTDLENTLAQLVWKTGIAGLLIAVAAILFSSLSVIMLYLRRRDPLAAAWLAAALPLLAIGLIGGLTAAPYSMAFGGWLGLSAVFSSSDVARTDSRDDPSVPLVERTTQPKSRSKTLS